LFLCQAQKDKKETLVQLAHKDHRDQSVQLDQQVQMPYGTITVHGNQTLPMQLEI
jgi:hypothetical protein